MKKNLMKLIIGLLAVSVLTLSGCNLASQIMAESWESAKLYEAYAAGTTVVSVDYELTFDDEESYTAEMTGTWGSTTVFSTRTGSYTLDGSTITLTGVDQTDNLEQTSLSEIQINAAWLSLALFPSEGNTAEFTVEKGKYLVVYDAITFTDADGNETVFTAAD